MHRLRLLVGSVALGVALTGAACSSGTGDAASKNPAAAIKAASAKTTSSGTVKLALTAKDKTNKTVLSGDGAYDFDKNQGRFTLTTQVGAAADMVITPAELYLKLPQQNTASKPWVGVTTKATGTTSQVEATVRNYLDSVRTQIDPRTTLDALAVNVTSLKQVGTQTVRGTPTTHLAGHVDLSDAAIKKAPARQRASLRDARKAFGSDGYPVDVWFDHQGRVRRVQYVLATGTGVKATSTTVRLDLFDFGKPAGITVPDPSQVGDAASLVPATTTTAPAKK